MPKFSNDPRNCVGFTQIYPDRLAELQRKREHKREMDEVATFSRLETAHMLDISLSTLDRMVKEKTIPHIRLGDRVIFRKRSLDAWLAGLEVRPKDDKDAK